MTVLLLVAFAFVLSTFVDWKFVLITIPVGFAVALIVSSAISFWGKKSV